MACRPHGLVLLFALALTIAGCQRLPEPTDALAGHAGQPLAEQSRGSAEPSTTFDIELERRLKSRRPGVRPIARTIDWQAADGLGAGDPERLDPEGAQRLADVPLPALLPDDDDLLGAAIVTRGETWYAASMTIGDLNVFVAGSAHAQRLPQHEPDLRGGSLDQPLLTRNELSPMASFEAFGAAYQIAVECAAPLDDERCTADDYMLSLLERLARFGGRP